MAIRFLLAALFASGGMCGIVAAPAGADPIFFASAGDGSSGAPVFVGKGPHRTQAGTLSATAELIAGDFMGTPIYATRFTAAFSQSFTDQAATVGWVFHFVQVATALDPNGPGEPSYHGKRPSAIVDPPSGGYDAPQFAADALPWYDGEKSSLTGDGLTLAMTDTASSTSFFDTFLVAEDLTHVTLRPQFSVLGELTWAGGRLGSLVELGFLDPVPRDEIRGLRSALRHGGFREWRPVPEPGLVSLVGGGLVAFGARLVRRRKRRRHSSGARCLERVTLDHRWTGE